MSLANIYTLLLPRIFLTWNLLLYTFPFSIHHSTKKLVQDLGSCCFSVLPEDNRGSTLRRGIEERIGPVGITIVMLTWEISYYSLAMKQFTTLMWPGLG